MSYLTDGHLPDIPDAPNTSAVRTVTMNMLQQCLILFWLDIPSSRFPYAVEMWGCKQTASYFGSYKAESVSCAVAGEEMVANRLSTHPPLAPRCLGVWLLC